NKNSKFRQFDIVKGFYRSSGTGNEFRQKNAQMFPKGGNGSEIEKSGNVSTSPDLFLPKPSQ
uniref:hypothetical protein n=1 Tax=Alistipes communis TaxID=2585118 RepID=UPI003FD85C02